MQLNAQLNQPANENDIELLELYLDHELADAEVRRLDERLVTEPSLLGTLDVLRVQRSNRLSAMSMAFDTDAASIERLVASVRVAQVNESMRRRRWALGPQTKSVFAAAACVAFGLLLGVTLQNRHAGSSGVVATPAAPQTSAWGLSSDASLSAQGTYVVSVSGSNGSEMMKVRFTSREQAQQFIESLNNRSANAQISEQPY